MDGGAKLLTLVGRFGGTDPEQQEVPLVSVLRDSLPGGDPQTDRLRYVWLLTYKPPRLRQRFLSAVPFFYWSLDSKEDVKSAEMPKPLVDLSQPAPRVWKTVGRDILQWTVLDPMTMPVRASSRTYRKNGLDRERLHVEEALTFLRNAPVGDDGSALSQGELDNVIARLNLTKNLLGGLMTEEQLERVTSVHDAARAETIARNWELLRTSAERAGLIFEPLHLTGSMEQYAVIWFPLETTFSAPGVSLQTTWKLLHISDPWKDGKLRDWHGYVQPRWLDEDGRLLPEGATGARQVRLAPLAAYSLTYPRTPLLMVDFRDSFRPKRRELVQRSSEELVSGVLGLSHFVNWYYYAGNALYQFVKARRGSAEDRAERLDSYSEFRVALRLNTSLDPQFRQELQRRAQALSINPLATSLDEDVALARHHFDALLTAAATEAGLPAQVDRDRRKELVNFGRGYSTRVAGTMLHYLALGTYTRRAEDTPSNVELLSNDRKIEALIRYLDRVANSGPQPEISFPADQILTSVNELASLLNSKIARKIQNRAVAVIARVQSQTRDETLVAGCSRALGLLEPAGAVVAQTPQKAVPDGSVALDTERSLRTK
jgi:hypothetical protein